MPIKKENIIRIMNETVIRTNYGNLGASTSTLIFDSNKKILIDVGHYGTRLRMLENLKKNNLNPNQIDYVILTHLNWDHCTNIDLFEKSKIFIHKREWKSGSLFGINDLATENFRQMLKKMKLNLIE